MKWENKMQLTINKERKKERKKRKRERKRERNKITNNMYAFSSTLEQDR